MAEDRQDLRAVERRERLGAAIRRLRGERTQTELGELLALPQTTISRWESGLVDLGLEQIRSLEHALEVPLGTIGRLAGYVEPAVGLDDDGRTSLRTAFLDTCSEAVEHIAAADTLGLGVLAWNCRTPADGGTDIERWVVTLLADAPVVDR